MGDRGSSGSRADKLRSLSIDRDDEEMSSRGLSWVTALALMIVSAGAAGGGVWWFLSGQGGPAGLAASDQPGQPGRTAASPAPAATPSPQPAPVVARARGLIASGYVTARRQATVSSEITGRIAEILVEEGAYVEAGQVLARLDAERAEIALDLARSRARAAAAAIDQIEADLKEARSELERTQSLRASDFTAESSLTEAAARVESLEAQLRRVRADAESARLDVTDQEDLVARHVVRAPFSGVIVGKNAQAGEIVSPTSAGGGFTRTGIYTLVDMTSLEIEVDVNEGSIERVSPGQKVEAVLDAYPDWRIPAFVEAIIPTADRSRATIAVRVVFAELDPRILPDMAAKVTFIEDPAG